MLKLGLWVLDYVKNISFDEKYFTIVFCNTNDLATGLYIHGNFAVDFCDPVWVWSSTPLNPFFSFLYDGTENLGII